jgi:hypothetical protein
VRLRPLGTGRVILVFLPEGGSLVQIKHTAVVWCAGSLEPGAIVPRRNQPSDFERLLSDLKTRFEVSQRTSCVNRGCTTRIALDQPAKLDERSTWIL